MMSKSYLLKLPFLCFIFVFSALFFHLLATPILQDPDGFWHLEAGRLLLRLHEIPQYDPWSFTAGEYRWFNLSWVFDGLAAWIFNVVGYAWLQTWMVLLYAGVLTLLCWVLMQKKQVSISAACLCTMLVAMSMWEMFSLRPHVFTYIMVVIYYHILKSAYENKERHLCFLPFLMVVWVNLHGGFLAGFVIEGAFALAALMQRRYAFLRRLSLMMLLSIPLIFLNPYGADIVEAVLRSLNSVITAYTDEWRGFVPGQYVGITAYYIFFVLFAYLFRAKDARLYDKILVLVWAILAISSIRHFPVFALLSAPYLAHILSESGYMRDFKKPFGKIAMVGVVGLTVLLPFSIGFKWLPQGLLYTANEQSRSYIEPEVMRVLEQFPEKRFLNHYALGGWLIHHSEGKHKVFIDSRAGTAYPQSLLQDYLQLMLSNDSWVQQKILEHYGIDGVVTSKHHPFAELFKSDDFAPYWQVVFEGEHGIVFIKRSVFANGKTREFASW